MKHVTFAAAALALLSLPALAAEWTYTDGKGVTVTLPEPPTRIVAHAHAAAGLMGFGIKPVGIFVDGPPEQDPSLKGLDLTGIEIVGTAWDKVDAEKVLALDPDLIIAEWWPRGNTYNAAASDDNMGSQLRQIAPLAGPGVGDSILGLIEDYSELAASLGADLAAPAIADEKARFETALADFKAALAEKPGLVVEAAYVGDSGISVALPEGAAELNDFKSWGMTLVEPSVSVNPYFEDLSWENVGKYNPDMILIDDRFGTGGYDFLRGNPIAQRLPAVAQDQLADWPAFWMRSYTAYADQLTELTAAIRAADATIGD